MYKVLCWENAQSGGTVLPSLLVREEKRETQINTVSDECHYGGAVKIHRMKREWSNSESLHVGPETEERAGIPDGKAPVRRSSE